MVTDIREETMASIGEYARIPSAFWADRAWRIRADVEGPPYWHVTEEPDADPFLKDYDAIRDNHPTDWPQQFDTTHWRVYAAWDKKPVAPDDTVVALVDDESDDHRRVVLKLLMTLSSQGFEQFCQRMLREAGFTQVTVTGRSNDHGIDGHGTLTLNPLVSFKVLFQCKRYKDTVSPAQVRDFRGAMAGRADKGIIITTGTFTAEARREAARDGVPPIELLDGEKLVALLEQLELGLKPVKAFEVDANFFRSFAGWVCVAN